MNRLLERHLAQIANGPQGADCAALFDLDRTLIEGFSAQDVLVDRLVRGDLSLGDIARTARATFEFAAGTIGFVEFVNRSARDLDGRSRADLEAFGRDLFERRIAQRIYPESRALVDAHRAAGHVLAVVSSATRWQVQSVAEDLGIDEVLCTELEFDGDVCTGRVREPACHGAGKLDAARAFAAPRGIDLARSWFYSDGHEDLPLLQGVGMPCALNPDARLAGTARRHGWPLLRHRSRGRPGPTELLRTGLAAGSAMPAAWIGVTDWLLGGSLQDARNVSGAVWADLAAAAIDLRLNVSGRRNLTSHRPAVFVFNHQSALDALVMMKLVRRDLTAVAKTELRTQPVVGPLFQAGGVVFVDRADRSKAIAALAPAVEALRRGVSVAIAPEGTRSATRRLGAFRKGAFHMAIEARVPMVPVVIRNSSDWLPKGAWFARPGTIDVDVLEPVDTVDWTARTIDEHVRDVRARFAAALATH